MTTIGLFFSRTRSATTVLAALAAVVFIATVALGMTLALVQLGTAAGSREVLDSAAPRSAAVRITTHLADDDTKQSAAAHGMIDRLFPRGTVAVHESQRSLPVAVRTAGGSATPSATVGGSATPSATAGGSAAPSAMAIFGVEADLLDYATITAGDWPAARDADDAAPADLADAAAISPGEVAIQADAAAALALGVGDTFAAGSDAAPLTLTVAALWRANDPADPVWFAESSIGSGHDGDALGVFVVAPATLRALPTQLFTSFTVTATHAALTDENRAATATGLDRLHDSVRATADVVDISSSTEGFLAATLARITDAGRGAGVIAASALVIVALLAVVALVQLCSVLVGSRRPHADLTRARGLSLPQLAVLSAAEALVLAVPSSALGALLCALVFAVSSPLTLVAIAVGMIFATVGCLVAVVLLGARTGARDATAARSPAAFIVGGSVIAAAAALATWQLYSRATVPGVDLVAATSPALALVAAAVLGTALFYPVTGAVALVAARRARLGTVLAARQLSRQVARYLVPALALAIAVSSAVFATGLATTWSTTESATQFAVVGSDVSVALSTDGANAITSEPFEALDGADAAAALVLASVSLGSDRLPLVALRPASVDRLLGATGADVSAALKSTTTDDAGLAIPAGATGLSAAVTFAGNGSTPSSTFDVGVWAADADGSLSRVSLTPASTPGTTDWTGPLPEGVGPWRLLAVETLRTGKADPAATSVEVAGLGAEAQSVVTLDLGAASPRAIGAITTPNQPSGDDSPLPVVVTTALATRIGVALGDPLSFTFEPTGKQIDAIVTALTPRLPGVSSKLALATDLLALDAVTLRPGSAPAEANEVWIASTSPTAVAADVARSAHSTAIVATRASTSSQPVLAPALTAFWLAAAAAALLALVAVGAFFADDVRRRRPDISVLRALGFSPGNQAATRGTEQLITVVFAVVIGTVAGAVATAVTVGPSIASAVPGSTAFVTVTPAFDPLPWLAFCAALALLALATCLALLVRVRRSASDAAANAIDGGV